MITTFTPAFRIPRPLERADPRDAHEEGCTHAPLEAQELIRTILSTDCARSIPHAGTSLDATRSKRCDLVTESGKQRGQHASSSVLATETTALPEAL